MLLGDLDLSDHCFLDLAACFLHCPIQSNDGETRAVNPGKATTQGCTGCLKSQRFQR